MSESLHLFKPGDLCPSWVIQVSPPRYQHFLRFVAAATVVRNASGVIVEPTSGNPVFSFKPEWWRRWWHLDVHCQGAPTKIVGGDVLARGSYWSWRLLQKVEYEIDSTGKKSYLNIQRT